MAVNEAAGANAHHLDVRPTARAVSSATEIKQGADCDASRMGSDRKNKP